MEGYEHYGQYGEVCLWYILIVVPDNKMKNIRKDIQKKIGRTLGNTYRRKDTSGRTHKGRQRRQREGEAREHQEIDPRTLNVMAGYK